MVSESVVSSLPRLCRSGLACRLTMATRFQVLFVLLASVATSDMTWKWLQPAPHEISAVWAATKLLRREDL